jgi:proline iminopeptidase
MGDDDNLAVANLETHYFLNKSFVPENYVVDNLDKIKHIPCTAIQGRFDMCTPPVSIYELSKQYGENMNLKWVNCGHMSSDQLMREELIQTFKKEF